jgi:hypothetical protein
MFNPRLFFIITKQQRLGKSARSDEKLAGVLNASAPPRNRRKSN